MNYKKYLIFIMLIMLIGINKIYADTCYYQVSGENSLAYDSETGKFKIKDADNEKVKWYQFAKKSEKLLNFNKDYADKRSNTGIKIEAIYAGTCPYQIVYRHKTGSDGIFGFNDSTKANEFLQASKELNGMEATLINRSYITEEEFEDNLIENIKKSGQNFNSNPNYGGSGIETSDEVMSCEELFDSSIIELINDILKYPRYIVPGIILVLGTLDLFKAVIAGKEDEMKKAQRTFIKRIIIGVLVFLVPLLINVIIWLANIAWQGLGYSTCNL